MDREDKPRGSKKRRPGIFSSVYLAVVILSLGAFFTLVVPVLITNQPYAVTWAQLMSEGRGMRMLYVTGFVSIIVFISYLLSLVRKRKSKF